MGLVDCHAHFYPPSFDMETIINHIHSTTTISARHPLLTLERIILTPERLQDFPSVLSLSKSFNPTIQTCLGLHPTHALDPLSPILHEIRQNAPHIIGVGEIGLDFSPWVLQSQQTQLQADMETVKTLQRTVFRQQILLAKSLDLPVNVHSRNAGHHAITLLEECGMLSKALLHAFDGAPKHAVRAASLGAMFSVAPILVRDVGMERWIEKVPIASLVLESDAPALAPVKGETNVPGNVGIACEALARVLKRDIGEVARITRLNSLRLFFPNEYRMELQKGHVHTDVFRI